MCASAADISLVEEIIAKVNGDIVTRSEIERGRRQLEQELRERRLAGTQLQQAIQEGSQNVLRDRIDALLLSQKGKELNINVDTEVSRYLADLQKKSGIADPEKFQQYVREQTGMPFEDFKAETKNGLLTQRVVRQEVASRINVKKEELKKYYDEHKSEFVREERVFLREILVSTEGKDAAGIAASEKKAKDLAARASKGEKFAEMAQANSDAQNAQFGGEMPGFKESELRPEIKAQVWDKPRGFVTPPIKLTNGFVIYKVEDHQKAGQAEFEEVENEIMDKVFSPRMQPAVRDYLTKLREQAFLEIKPGYVDAGAAAGKDTTWTDPAQLKPETVTKEQVAQQKHRKKLLWAIPLPGTSNSKSKNSSSR
jgi:parvulin-like peptidyl-prolyl isomerase